MVRKKPFKVDPPTKTITITGVSSSVADQFNRLMSERTDISGLSKAKIFEDIVLNERTRDVGEHRVRYTMESYRKIQEKLKQFNEKLIQSNKNIEDGPI